MHTCLAGIFHQGFTCGVTHSYVCLHSYLRPLHWHLLIRGHCWVFLLHADLVPFHSYPSLSSSPFTCRPINIQGLLFSLLGHSMISSLCTTFTWASPSRGPHTGKWNYRQLTPLFATDSLCPEWVKAWLLLSFWFIVLIGKTDMSPCFLLCVL